MCLYTVSLEYVVAKPFMLCTKYLAYFVPVLAIVLVMGTFGKLFREAVPVGPRTE